MWTITITLKPTAIASTVQFGHKNLNQISTPVIIARYVRDFEGTLLEERSEETSQEYIERIVGNPVHAFQLMRRFTVDIPNIEKDLKKDDWKGLCSGFK